MKKLILIVLAVSLLAGCSTGVVAVGKDTYMIGRRSAAAGFGPPLGAKAETYVEANEFCDKQNKKVKTLTLNMTDSGFAKPGTVELTFLCVSERDLP